MAKNRFMSDKEYANSFFGIRRLMAKTLIPYSQKSRLNILDILAGHGFYSKEIAKFIKRSNVTAIGLQNDKESYENYLMTRKNKNQISLLNKITYKVMDVTNLEFPDETFDMVVNFLGLEDVNMTRGIKGVKDALRESVRVLKTNGIIQITLCQEGNDKDQELAKEITKAIGHRAIFYEPEFYTKVLERHNIEIFEKKWFYTKRKMTALQAKDELLFACDETPKIFKKYDVKTIPFEKLWERYERRLLAVGMAYYSELLTIIGRKSNFIENKE
jgi:ubiquinone/menaquinone biosynthesis C-methylase UbiE